MRVKFQFHYFLILAIALLCFGGCTNLTTSDHEKVEIQAFATQLSNVLDDVPERWTAFYNSTNQAIQRVRLLVANHPDLILNMLTNSSETWYSARAQFALILSGEAASDLLVPLTALLHDREYAATVAGILPFLGTNGMSSLAAGLHSPDEYVRRVCAANLAWPIQNYDGDKSFKDNYRDLIRPYLDHWVRALYDSDKRVGRAAAKSLGYVGANDKIAEALEGVVNSSKRTSSY